MHRADTDLALAARHLTTPLKPTSAPQEGNCHPPTNRCRSPGGGGHGPKPTGKDHA